MNKYKVKEGLYLFGILFIVIVFIPFLNPYFGYVIKYDYFWQHIPYHNEFFNLLDHGLPFWSWNFFLGKNFWGSTSFSVVGDVFTWITYFVNKFVHNLTQSMSFVLILKFIVGYTGFFLLSKTFTSKNIVRLIVSLMYVFSGWSTTFIEQTYFTSFYMLLPFMFWGVELYLSKKIYWIYIVFTTLLIMSDFYFFWPAALILLIYWIYRYLCNHEKFSFKEFFIESLKMLGLTLISLGISTPIWLPGILHLASSTRLGNFLITYESWDGLNIASFFVFSFIPVLKYLDGFLKDSWYYFNQMGLYYGSFSLLLLPQIVFVFKKKRLKIINLMTMVLLYALLISPKIGFLFHFTYSLRYTFLITFMGLVVVTQILEWFDRINIKILVITEIIVLIGFFVLKRSIIPALYVDALPRNMSEFKLLEFVVLCTLGYTLLTGLKLSSISRIKWIGNILTTSLILLTLIEIFVQGRAALKSQDVLQEQYSPPFELSIDYTYAVDYIKSIDSGLYRIYQNNGYLSNINLLHDYKSISTYDSVFQYSTSKFLDWVHQYPDTNWEFRFNEPSFNQLLGVRYAIIDTSIGESFMSNGYYAEELQRFGVYRVMKYKTETSLAFTYNVVDTYASLEKYLQDHEDYPLFELGAMMDQTLFIDDQDLTAFKNYTNQDIQSRIFFQPSSYNQNYVSFDMTLPVTQMVYFSIPFDKGWRVTVDGREIEPLIVQGGFMSLAVDGGSHKVEFKFTPIGLISGLIVSGISILVFIFMYWGKTFASRFLKRRSFGDKRNLILQRTNYIDI